MKPHDLSINEFDKLTGFNLAGYNNSSIMYKNWGYRIRLLKQEDKVVDLCFILKNGQSSNHRHTYLSNEFNLLAGKLNIHGVGTLIALHDKLKQVTMLPGIPHYFCALEHTMLLEIYYLPKLPFVYADDIVRVVGSVGGILE